MSDQRALLDECTNRPTCIAVMHLSGCPALGGTTTGHCWCGSPVGHRPDKGFIDCLADRSHDWRGRELRNLDARARPTSASDDGGCDVCRGKVWCPICEDRRYPTQVWERSGQVGERLVVSLDECGRAFLLESVLAQLLVDAGWERAS